MEIEVRYSLISDCANGLSSFSHQEWYQPHLAERKSDKRRAEFIAAIVVLRNILGFEPQIAYLNNGKPYLLNAQTNISISHCKDYVCVAVSDKYKVGIDIEQVSPRIDSLAQRFMTAGEFEELNKRRLEDNDQLSAREFATLVWCSKEAVYKIVGDSVADFPANQQIIADSSEFFGMVIPSCRTIQLKNIAAPDNHIIVLAYD